MPSEIQYDQADALREALELQCKSIRLLIDANFGIQPGFIWLWLNHIVGVAEQAGLMEKGARDELNKFLR
jgi:hypothetical protein